MEMTLVLLSHIIEVADIMHNKKYRTNMFEKVQSAPSEIKYKVMIKSDGWEVQMAILQWDAPNWRLLS